MNLINLTGKTITFWSSDGSGEKIRLIPSSKRAYIKAFGDTGAETALFARPLCELLVKDPESGEITEVPLVHRRKWQVIGIPEPKIGTIYVVNADIMGCPEAANRPDVCFAYPVEEGQDPSDFHAWMLVFAADPTHGSLEKELGIYAESKGRYPHASLEERRISQWALHTMHESLRKEMRSGTNLCVDETITNMQDPAPK